MEIYCSLQQSKKNFANPPIIDKAIGMVSVAAFFDSRVVVSMNEIMFIRTLQLFFLQGSEVSLKGLLTGWLRGILYITGNL